VLSREVSGEDDLKPVSMGKWGMVFVVGTILMENINGVMSSEVGERAEGGGKSKSSKPYHSSFFFGLLSWHTLSWTCKILTQPIYSILHASIL
jgi:hypothetical protein